MTSAEIRRCRDEDWSGVRRLHLKMALAFPMVVDVDLNRVLEATDAHWQDFVHACAEGADQALFVAEADARCAGMGHVSIEDDLARLSMLYVDDSQRRHGIGAALAAAEVQWAHDADATDLTCHIPEDSPAERIAEAFGLRRTDEVFFTRHRLKERKWAGKVEVFPSAKGP